MLEIFNTFDKLETAVFGVGHFFNNFNCLFRLIIFVVER